MSLELDFEILCDDYDRLVVLESLGVRPDFPAVQAICRRWCLDDGWSSCSVAGESREMMERAQYMTDTDHRSGGRLVAKRLAVGTGEAAVGLAGKGLKGAAKLTGKLSKKLAVRFYDFAEEIAKEQATHLKDAVSKAEALRRKVKKLIATLSLLDDHQTLAKVDVHTGSWTAKVCYQDKIDFDTCIKFSKQTNAYEGVVQKYTVRTRTLLRKSEADGPSGLVQLSKSTNWAVKRSAGLLGIVDPFKKVEAYPIPGNIIMVEHHSGRMEWAIARDGTYPDVIESLDTHQCGKAVEAIEALIKSIATRGTKSKISGYTGIYAEVEVMRGDLKDLDGKELKEATLRYRNALAMEDAFTTALVRVAEGLIEWTSQSLRAVK